MAKATVCLADKSLYYSSDVLARFFFYVYFLSNANACITGQRYSAVAPLVTMMTMQKSFSLFRWMSLALLRQLYMSLPMGYVFSLFSGDAQSHALIRFQIVNKLGHRCILLPELPSPVFLSSG